jgi:hypothetical protein
VSDRSVACHGGIVAVARAIGGFSNRGMVMAETGGAPVPCLLGERRSIHPSPFEATGNSSMESPIMVHGGDDGPPRVESTTMVPETSPEGERLMPPKRSMMNSRLQKQMVSPREKPPHDRHSPSAATPRADDETIGTSRGKACCKCPYLACQLSVFFPPVRYRVVKIVRSCSEMVL